MNTKSRSHTAELIATRKLLQMETVRRKAADTALKESQRHL